MTTFLWALIVLAGLSVVGRLIAVSKWELPRRTWGLYLADGLTEVILLAWAVGLLAKG